MGSERSSTTTRRGRHHAPRRVMVVVATLLGALSLSATPTSAQSRPALSLLALAGGGSPTSNFATGASSSSGIGVLDDVWCPTANVCEAVGHVNSETLAEVWNGKSWKTQPTPNPNGATLGSELLGVSCPTANACGAVGLYQNSPSDEFMMAEVWNGTSWKLQKLPNPAGATYSALFGVSCPTANVCEAVGQYDKSSDGFVALAEVWNGTSWKLQKIPNSAGTAAVSCPTVNVCEAVGGALAEGWNGKSWKTQPIPNPAGATFSEILGLSCPTANACEAVGSYDNSSDDIFALAEVWNGTSWKLQKIPNSAGATGKFYYEVSCPTANDCEAVGGFGASDSDDSFTLADVWNGTSWKLQKLPSSS